MGDAGRRSGAAAPLAGDDKVDEDEGGELDKAEEDEDAEGDAGAQDDDVDGDAARADEEENEGEEAVAGGGHLNRKLQKNALVNESGHAVVRGVMSLVRMPMSRPTAAPSSAIHIAQASMWKRRCESGREEGLFGSPITVVKTGPKPFPNAQPKKAPRAVETVMALIEPGIRAPR